MLKVHTSGSLARGYTIPELLYTLIKLWQKEKKRKTKEHIRLNRNIYEKA